MGLTPHAWCDDLLGDPEIEAALGGERALRHMCAVEAALLVACAEEGLVPTEAADLHDTVRDAAFDPASFREAVARDGVIVPELVRRLRQSVPADLAASVHFGATSQDIIDTALALSLKDANARLLARLMVLIDALSALDARWGEAPLMARTRMQAAQPITAGHRIRGWRTALETLRDRAGPVFEHAHALQLGGAVGTREPWGAAASGVARRMAERLDLHEPGAAWHSDRARLLAYAEWTASLSGTLGKMGQDVALMAQQGVDEVTLSGGGGSSAMPHKSNPVLAEALVTLARLNAVELSAMAQAQLHEQERSGAAWTLEWAVLPRMVVASGASLRHAATLVASVTRLGAPAGG